MAVIIEVVGSVDGQDIERVDDGGKVTLIDFVDSVRVRVLGGMDSVDGRRKKATGCRKLRRFPNGFVVRFEHLIRDF